MICRKQFSIVEWFPIPCACNKTICPAKGCRTFPKPEATGALSFTAVSCCVSRRRYQQAKVSLSQYNKRKNNSALIKESTTAAQQGFTDALARSDALNGRCHWWGSDGTLLQEWTTVSTPGKKWKTGEWLSEKSIALPIVSQHSCRRATRVRASNKSYRNERM